MLQFHLITVIATPHWSVVDRWYRPMIRIIRNTGLISIRDFMLDVSIVIGIGNNSAISSSKIMQVTAIGKNRDKNVSRAECFFFRRGGGSNPHSTGDLFSRSSLIFFEIRVARIIIAVHNRMTRRDGIRTPLVMKLRTIGVISILPYSP